MKSELLKFNFIKQLLCLNKLFLKSMAVKIKRLRLRQARLKRCFKARMTLQKDSSLKQYGKRFFIILSRILYVEKIARRFGEHVTFSFLLFYSNLCTFHLRYLSRKNNIHRRT